MSTIKSIFNKFEVCIMNRIKSIIKFLCGLLEIEIMRIILFSLVTLLFLMAFIHRIIP